MGELTARNFGLLIAYVLPGFVGLWGLGYVSEPVRAWLVGAGPAGPSVGGVLYVLVASIGCGMTASAVRWAVVDTVHHRTGLKRPDWDDSKLPERLEAFEALVDNHFRYYQFYANSLTSGLAAYAAWRCSSGPAAPPVGALEAVLLGLMVVFIAGSRDALRRYYSRTALLLGTLERTVDDDERTQAHHGGGSGHEGHHPHDPAAGEAGADHRGVRGDGGPAAHGRGHEVTTPTEAEADTAPFDEDGAAPADRDGQ